jgi:hypothetical protein
VTHYEAECARVVRTVRRAMGCTRAEAEAAVRAVGPDWVRCVEWLRRQR